MAAARSGAGWLATRAPRPSRRCSPRGSDRARMATLGLAFLAGVLSILNPCTLPILPVVLGAAISEHRYGPLFLAAGLTLSFTAIGLFVATVGFAIGLDADVFRSVAAVLLVAVGVVLVLPAL